MRLPIPGILASSASILFILTSSAFGQTAPASEHLESIRVHGPADNDVAVPATTSSLGRQDAAAFATILDFLKAIGGESWTGMQATASYTGADSHTVSPAHLTIRGADRFRLDVTAPRGEMSIRIHGNNGQILESDGKKHTLPPATAENGLFIFPKLFDSSFIGNQTSLIDRGLVSIENHTLHKITIENAVDHAQTPASAVQVDAVDLYFDPSTYLLAKSVMWVQLDSADRGRYLQVVTYDDYEKVDNLLLPLKYRQTLNGQVQWTLELTDVQLNPSAAQSYFQF